MTYFLRDPGMLIIINNEEVKMKYVKIGNRSVF